MLYEEDRERIRQLAMLCLESRELTDEELDGIITQKDAIEIYLFRVSNFASYGAEKEKRYRRRKQQLNKLSTEELERMWNGISVGRLAFLATDVNDELPDSAYEAPPKESDEHIVYELLEERRRNSNTSTVSQ